MDFNCDLVESKTNCSDSSIENLEGPNRDKMLVIHSGDNSRVGVADLDKELQHNIEVTNSECSVPFANATEDSALKSYSYLKRLKEVTFEECVSLHSSPSLHALSTNGDFETENSTAHVQQAVKKMLSENDEEMCVDVSGGAIGSRHSPPHSVECTQYDEENERTPKSKHRNKRNRSTGLIGKGLKTEQRAAGQERRKMVAIISVFAATIFLTAVFLIVVTLHMSPSANSNALSMGGAPENQTAGNGEQGDRSFLQDVTSHLGSDTRNDRDNKTFTQHNSTSSAPDKEYPVL